MALQRFGFLGMVWGVPESLELWDQGLSRSPSNSGKELWIHQIFWEMEEKNGKKKALKEYKVEGIPSLRTSGLSTGRIYGIHKGFSNFPLKKGFGGTQDKIFMEWISHIRRCDVQPTTHTKHSCIFQKPGIPWSTLKKNKIMWIIWDDPVIQRPGNPAKVRQSIKTTWGCIWGKKQLLIPTKQQHWWIKSKKLG